MASSNSTGLPPLNSPLISVNTSGFITSPWYLFLLNLWNRTGGGTGGGTLQSGDLKITASSANQPGCLQCLGQEVSRTIYAPLFQAIGISFGAGDGSTTFNLPNTQDNVLLGSSPTFPLAGHGTLGASGNAAVNYLTFNVWIKT